MNDPQTQEEPFNLLQIVNVILKTAIQSLDVTDAALVLPEAKSKRPHILVKSGNLTEVGWRSLLSREPAPTLDVEIAINAQPEKPAHLIFHRPGKSDWNEKVVGQAEVYSSVISDLFSAYSGEVDWMQLTASQRILPVTEEELTRIILDIHDGPVQYLFAAFSMLSNLQNDAKDGDNKSRPYFEKIEKISDLIEIALAEIRIFVGTFRPPEFAERDLIKLLEGLVIQHEQFTDAQIHLEVGDDIPAVNVPIKIALYRIVQEALSNAYRHAGVEEHFLRVWAHRDHIHIEIVDYGKGFEPPPLDGPLATEEERHIGLRGMRDRVHLVGGHFRIESVPKKGTAIHVSVPVVG